MVETHASKNHQDFVSATGDPIINYGEVRIPMITREQTLRGMTFQAAGVAKGLCSVEKMCQAGHVVVFDGDNSYVYNKHTHEVNMLRREEGNFMLDVWVPPPSAVDESGFGRQP